uniref:Uncharacterized protein n=1 Tax=Acrobeloides nanus TaxID=290746 RepID=A0A914DF96_9BILA
MQFYYYMDRVRDLAIHTYVVIISSLAIERTMATLMLKSYEKCTKRSYLIIVILIQWGLGIGINCIIYNGIISDITFIIILAVGMVISINWQIFLGYMNLYRYNNRLSMHYNLKERFQLSENIRFLKIIKWSALTMTIFDITALLSHRVSQMNITGL